MDDAAGDDSVYINACKMIIESYPESIYWGRTFYPLFEKYRKMRDKKDALEYFAHLISQYPNSRISDAAEDWLERMQKEEL